MTEESVPWPSVAEQLAAAGAQPGTALETTILDNQEMHMLRPEEATDRLGIPVWLRVMWHKNHPDAVPGVYPLTLRDLATWMTTHQDLVPEHDKPTGASGGDDPTAAE
jgi:hypothetical protein